MYIYICMCYQFGIYIYMCMYMYICIYPSPEKRKKWMAPKKGKQFPKGSLDHIPIDFPGGGMLSFFLGVQQKKWYRVVMMVLSCQVWWWQMLWVGSCGFLGGGWPFCFWWKWSPKILPQWYFRRMWGLGWWKMEGRLRRLKDPRRKWLMRDHLHGLFIYDSIHQLTANSRK